MKIKIACIVMLLFILTKLTAQTSDEEAVKQTAKMESEAYLNKDTAAWKALFVQNEKTTRTTTSSSGYYESIGWQNFGPAITAYLGSGQEQMKYLSKDYYDFIVTINGNMAFLQYNQAWKYSNTDSPYRSREMRTMVKDDNKWKIISMATINTGSFTYGDSTTVENSINATGYQLLQAKRFADAIELFKLNVKMNPKSWNTYDSLGEAYADNGNNEDAIKNYELSIKLNPENDNGKQMLEKLKKK